LILDGSPKKVIHNGGCLVVHKSSNGGCKPFSLNDRDPLKIPPPSIIQYEGLYILGGKDKEGEIHGDLYILVIGKSPCNWLNVQKYIEKEGPSPSPRYGHDMHYSPEMNMVILFGGRNDSYGDPSR